MKFTRVGSKRLKKSGSAASPRRMTSPNTARMRMGIPILTILRSDKREPSRVIDMFCEETELVHDLQSSCPNPRQSVVQLFLFAPTRQQYHADEGYQQQQRRNLEWQSRLPVEGLADVLRIL